MYRTGTPEDIQTTFLALINGFPGSYIRVGVAVCKICIAMLWSPDSTVTMKLSTLIQPYWESRYFLSRGVRAGVLSTLERMERDGETYRALRSEGFGDVLQG